MRTYLLTAIVLICSFNSEAKVDRIPGQIFFYNDTVEVTFLIFTLRPGTGQFDRATYQKLQRKVKYIDSTGIKKVLRPKDALEIKFRTYQMHDGSYVYTRMVSVRGKFIEGTRKTRFLKLEVDGYLRLFTWYTTVTSHQPNRGSVAPSMHTSHDIEVGVFQKGTDVILVPYNGDYKRDIVRYLSDCPGLIQKIEGDEFSEGTRGRKGMAKYYNENCISD